MGPGPSGPNWAEADAKRNEVTINAYDYIRIVSEMAILNLGEYFLGTYFHDVTLWKLKSELIVEKQIVAVFIVLKNDAKL